jgi:hypothetical protein
MSKNGQGFFFAGDMGYIRASHLKIGQKKFARMSFFR